MGTNCSKCVIGENESEIYNEKYEKSNLNNRKIKNPFMKCSYQSLTLDFWQITKFTLAPNCFIFSAPVNVFPNPISKSPSTRIPRKTLPKQSPI